MKIEEKIKQDVEKMTRDELKNVRKKISNYIESALLNIIGLEKRYSNDYEIDHCNGRNSVLIDTFREMAKEEATKIAKNYKPTKEDVAGFQEAFKKEFKSQFGYVIRDLAKEKAIEEARKMTDKIKIDVNKIFEEETKKSINVDIPF